MTLRALTRAVPACSTIAISYPNLAAAALRPLGAVHLRVCVAADSGAGVPPDASLSLQAQ